MSVNSNDSYSLMMFVVSRYTSHRQARIFDFTVLMQ